MRKILAVVALPVLSLACGFIHEHDDEEVPAAPAASGAPAAATPGAPTGAPPGSSTGSPPAMTPDGGVAPTGPDVAVETCTKQGTLSGQPWLFAEHAYPGKTALELSAVRVLAQTAGAYTATVDGKGYGNQSNVPWVQDGFAAVQCGPVNGQAFYTTVTFILPP